MYKKLSHQNAFSTYYTGSQEKFILAGTEASKEVAQTIQENFQKTDLFEKCMDLCAKKRETHAKEVVERGKEDFGVLRVRSSAFMNTTIMLDLRYDDYGVKLIEKIQKVYGDQILQGGFWQFKKIGDKKTSLSLREISLEERQKVQNLVVRAQADEIEYRDRKPCYSRKYKENHPDEYKDLVIKDGLEKLKALEHAYEPPDNNTRYLHAIARLRIIDPKDRKKKLYATSQYLFRVDLSQDQTTREFLPPLIIHQDIFLISILQKEAERWFLKAVCWSHEDGEQELKKSIGRMVYCLSHAMPYRRGTAAIIEWLEAGVYRYHGFVEAKTSDQVMMNLEALTEPSLEEFLKSYYEHVNLGERQA